jgi:hypothetical protein
MKVITSISYSINGRPVTKEEAIQHIIKRQEQRKPA